MRWLILLVALPFLGACDGDKLPSPPDPPAKPKVQSSGPSPEPVVTTEPASLEPAPSLDAAESEEGAPASIEIELDPVTAGDPDELPSERVVSEPPPKPAPLQAKQDVAVEHVELPEPKLDLSLPEDWTEEIEPGQGTATMRLLPPLFDSGDSRSVQMSGRLLPGLEQDETLIDGAQINFELRR